MSTSQLRIPISRDRSQSFDMVDALNAGIIVTVCAILYGFCAPMTLHPFDAPERAVMMLELGISHPSGSPLHALFGNLFLKPYRVFAPEQIEFYCNLFSAISMALAAGMLYMTTRLFSSRQMLCALVTAAIATSALPWSQAIYSEVYAFHFFLVSMFLFFWCRWLLQDVDRDLFAAAFLFTFSMGAHMSSSLFAPGIFLSIIVFRPQVFLRPRQLGGAIFFLLLGFSWVFYILIRARTAHMLGTDVPPESLAELFRFLTGNQFDAPSRIVLPSWQERLSFLGMRSLMGLGLVLIGSLFYGLYFIVLGVRSGFRVKRFRAFNWMAIVSFAAFWIYFGLHPLLDFGTLIMPIYALFAVWMILGAERVLEVRFDKGLKINRARQKLIVGLSALVVAQLLVFPALSLVHRSYAPVKDRANPAGKWNAVKGKAWSGLDKISVFLRGDDRDEISTKEVIAELSDVPGDKLLIANWDAQTYLYFKQRTEGSLSDTRIIEWHVNRFYRGYDAMQVDTIESAVRDNSTSFTIFALCKEPPDVNKGHIELSPDRMVPAHYRNQYRFNNIMFYLYRLNPVAPKNREFI